MDTGLPLFMLPSVHSFKYSQLAFTSLKSRRSSAPNNVLQCTSAFSGHASSVGKNHDPRTKFVVCPTPRAGVFAKSAVQGFQFRRIGRNTALYADVSKTDTLHADEGSEESFARDAAWEAFFEDDALNDKLLQSVRNERARKKTGSTISLWDMYGLYMNQVFVNSRPVKFYTIFRSFKASTMILILHSPGKFFQARYDCILRSCPPSGSRWTTARCSAAAPTARSAPPRPAEAGGWVG